MSLRSFRSLSSFPRGCHPQTRLGVRPGLQAPCTRPSSLVSCYHAQRQKTQPGHAATPWILLGRTSGFIQEKRTFSHQPPTSGQRKLHNQAQSTFRSLKSIELFRSFSPFKSFKSFKSFRRHPENQIPLVSQKTPQPRRPAPTPKQWPHRHPPSRQHAQLQQAVQSNRAQCQFSQCIHHERTVTPWRYESFGPHS